MPCAGSKQGLQPHVRVFIDHATVNSLQILSQPFIEEGRILFSMVDTINTSEQPMLAWFLLLRIFWRLLLRSKSFVRLLSFVILLCEFAQLRFSQVRTSKFLLIRRCLSNCSLLDLPVN